MQLLSNLNQSSQNSKANWILSQIADLILLIRKIRVQTTVRHRTPTIPNPNALVVLKRCKIL